MKFVRKLLFTDIDFCKPKIIQGLDSGLENLGSLVH